MKALVLFASKSDEEVYKRIAAAMKELGIDYDLRIASAHKTPDRVEEIIKGQYDVIVSGAGLAAHLSGVIAARKIVPVLGVPCAGAYDGLDSFLSIVQMPPGIPLLMVNAQNVAKEVKKIISATNKIMIVGEGNAADKAAGTLEKMKIEYSRGEIKSDCINIVFTELGQQVKSCPPYIYCFQHL